MSQPGAWPPIPTLIGHRGASALRPEHTLAAYTKAIEDGADFIEPDLVATKDGELVARHENAICVLAADGKVREATTDVAERPGFADRCATKIIDGQPITGWFTEDFTLAELKQLRACERIPAIRPANTRFNGQFEIATFQEIIDLAKAASRKTGRTIGVYAETKHPAYFRSIGLPLEAPLIALLAKNGWNDAAAPVFLQSFEPSSLTRMRADSGVRMVQLVESRGGPFDAAAGAELPALLRSYAEMVAPAGLAEVARYAQGVGPSKQLVLPVSGDDLGPPTALVAAAHAAGLLVHVWTLRPENAFLPARFRADPASDPSARGDMAGEIARFLAAGIDGIFCDDPALGRAALQAFASAR